MFLVWILALLGFNSLVYSVIVAFLFRPSSLLDRHPKADSFLGCALFVLSLPGSLIYDSVYNADCNRFYDKHIKDMRTLRDVATKQGKPPEWEINLHQWDVDLYEDEFGRFDLYGWKSHEYKKLGL